MKRPRWLKITSSSLLALIALAGLILPVAAEIGGTEVIISSLGGGSPDIEVSSDGTFVAVTYFKQENGAGAVYVKSATAAAGWLTSSLVGFGSNPQLAFRTGVNNIVYVVWTKGGGAAIQSAQCTLAALTPPICVAGADVRTAGANSLDFPDITVDSSGFIHVAWENNGVIETARSTAANSLSAWSAPATVSGGGADQKPVLAWSSGNGGRLHLAFLRGATPTQVEYRRSVATSHVWGTPATFRIGFEIIGSAHDALDNPAIAASASNVFLAWDAHRTGNDFSLIQATSANNGTSWAGSPTYAPSGTTTTISGAGVEEKGSEEVGVPAQEAGLRPSLAISGTSAALVWQQIPGIDGCASFDTSRIHYANPPTATVSVDTLSNNGDDDYMIDSDLAVAAGVRHFVYMRDLDTGCPGDLAIDYVITYRGPFTVITNDHGEGGGIYLPIIKK